MSRLLDRLEDDEFSVPGHVVADIALAQEPQSHADGAVTLALEALTVEE